MSCFEYLAVCTNSLKLWMTWQQLTLLKPPIITAKGKWQRKSSKAVVLYHPVKFTWNIIGLESTRSHHCFLFLTNNMLIFFHIQHFHKKSVRKYWRVRHECSVVPSDPWASTWNSDHRRLYSHEIGESRNQFSLIQEIKNATWIFSQKHSKQYDFSHWGIACIPVWWYCRYRKHRSPIWRNQHEMEAKVCLHWFCSHLLLVPH